MAYKELNDEQLVKVTGGATKATINTNGKKYVKCEPRIYPSLVKVDGKVAEVQKAKCSDETFKGLKSECSDCAANK